jgi:hypothetical protein
MNLIYIRSQIRPQSRLQIRLHTCRHVLPKAIMTFSNHATFLTLKVLWKCTRNVHMSFLSRAWKICVRQDEHIPPFDLLYATSRGIVLLDTFGKKIGEPGTPITSSIFRPIDTPKSVGASSLHMVPRHLVAQDALGSLC